MLKGRRQGHSGARGTATGQVELSVGRPGVLAAWLATLATNALPNMTLLPGDTLFPVPSGGVTLMYSFPNMLPLPAEQVGGRVWSWLPSPRSSSQPAEPPEGPACHPPYPPDIRRKPCQNAFACPVPPWQVARIGRRLEGCAFDRMYGPFAHTLIKAGAAQQVQQSVRKYCGLLDGSVQRTYM